MGKRKFDFTQADHATPKPLLEVRITNLANGKSVPTYALLDTGAAMCALPQAFIRVLGFKKRKLERITLGTGNGRTKGYIASCKIEILNSYDTAGQASSESGEECALATHFDVIDDAPIVFLPALKDALIGVEKILCRYLIEIDYPNETFSLDKQDR